ncbi:MAG: hypothetical protein OXE98_01855, partial [Hyphomicrobiales bacterium]|nr:hypothetical protein [Hyphomicrobiales bacterium]
MKTGKQTNNSPPFRPPTETGWRLLYPADYAGTTNNTTQASVAVKFQDYCRCLLADYQADYQTYNGNAKTHYTCYLQEKNSGVSLCCRAKLSNGFLYVRSKPFITSNKSFNGGFILGKGCFVV